uniref:Uncharacterized protein n=1 Tax=Trypanosoma rangeli TaxID=5698 RepID=R9TNK9_TRYRA|nr:hypothetical protein [Trypanosoma rangeli]
MLFLPCMMLMCSCEAVDAAKASGSQSIALFKVGETRLSTSVGNGAVSGENDVKTFNGHSLVEVGGLMVALAKANFRGASDPNVGMWEKHVSATGEGWARQVVAQDNTGWWTGIAVRQRGEADGRSQLGGPKAVAKANKIFLLLEHLRAKAAASQATFDLELFVGTAGEPTAEGKPIVWSAGNLTNAAVTAHLNEKKWSKFWGSNGRGVLLRNGTIVFPLVAVTTDGNKGVCTIISSDDDGHTWNFPVKGFVEKDCSEPNLFEWEGKLLMVATHAKHQKKVHASSDVGETWTELGGTHSNVLSEAVKAAPSGGRVDILTASIEGREVVLFTLHGQFNDVRKTNALHLYMTDMARFYPVGPISADGAVKTSGSLLYVNGELFSLHEQQVEKGAVVVVFTHLSAQLAEIKHVLRTWDAVDKKVALLCNHASKEEAAPGNACGTAQLTAGLVGFLSSGGDSNNWVNEYLGVNASLTGAERGDAGVVFKRTAAGGVWRVGNRWQNQRFHFVNDNFTLVATVVIQRRQSDAGPIPLLGARGAGEAKLMELSCASDYKWVTTFNAATNHVPDRTWELNRAHQLALVLQDGSGSMYVDAQPLGSPVQLQLAGEAGRDVSEFYFLGTGNNQVAVRNVLLYNRPLTTAELQVFLQRGGQTETGSQKKEGGSQSTGNSAAAAPAEARGVDSAAASASEPRKETSAPSPAKKEPNANSAAAAPAEARGVDSAAASASEPRKETSAPSPAKEESSTGNTASGAAVPSPVKGIGDRAVRTRASAVLPLFLGLWGIAALC